MKLIRSPLCGRVLIVGALALVPAATLAAPAFATSPTVQHFVDTDYICRAGTNIFNVPTPGVEVGAPDSVKFGEDFKIVIKQPVLTVFQTIDTGPATTLRILELTEVRQRYDLPTNATFHGASLEGGSGFSSARLNEINNGLLETIRGPVPPGGQLFFPNPIIKVEADFPDTEIVTRLGGTSFDDPGLEVDFKVQDMAGNISHVTVSCFPDQGVVLSTIPVGSENNNNGENHGNKPNKPNRPYKQHKPCDKVDGR